MAMIPLRIYNREIENLIDRGQNEEAIAHCKHILQTFPKHLDTYRLLGKAYLESQKYVDAADIMQRVLSSLPDDFVCQVGMSIIREDEGDLDAAIWHMERAFEVQPSNAAVQDELRRLYGRRDGIQPAKVRLTRGSLARMYARGDLYHQAIAEIKATLAEDPSRTDMQVLLAKTYFLSGQKVEATEICSQIIGKFPYSYDANRILAEILPGTSRAEDATLYQQRIYALDPYMAYASPDALSSAEVPDNSVNIERLEWDATGGAIVTPEWATSLGIHLEDKEPQVQELPDWLAALAPSALSPRPGAEELVRPSIPNESLPELELPIIEEPQAETPIASDLQAAPPEISAGAEEQPSQPLPEWMAEAGWTAAAPGEEAAFTAGPEETEGANELPTAEIPEWLRSLKPTADIQKPKEEIPTSSGMEWLQGIPPTVPTSELSPFSGTEQPALPEEEIPDWLQELKLASSDEVEAPKSAASEAEIPSWAQEVDSRAAEVTKMVEPPPSAEKQATLAWLDQLAAEHGSDAETLLVHPEDRIAMPPQWILEKNGEAPEIPAEAETEPGAEDLTPEPGEPFTAEEMSTAPIEEAQSADRIEGLPEIPQWETASSGVEEFPGEPAAEDNLDEGVITGQAGAEALLEPVEPVGEPAQPQEAFEQPPEAGREPEEMAVEPGQAVESGIEFPEISEIQAIESEGEQVPFESEAATEELAEKEAVEAPETPVMLEQPSESEIAAEVETESEGEKSVELPEWLRMLEKSLDEEQLTAEVVSEEPLSAVEKFEIEAQPAPTGAEFFVEEPSAEAAVPSPEIEEQKRDEVTSEPEPAGYAGEEIPTEASLIGEEISPKEQVVEPVAGEAQAEIGRPQPEEAVSVNEEPSPELPQEEEPVLGTAPELPEIVPSEILFESAQEAIATGHFDEAASAYSQVIREGKLLEETIHALRSAVEQYPDNLELWQTLGDAYSKSNQLQEALNAYTMAEELIN